MKDNNSLAHSTWNCKYHLVFAPKYRRMQIYGQIRKRYRSNIKEIMRTKRNRNNRSRIMPRPHTYACKVYHLNIVYQV